MSNPTHAAPASRPSTGTEYASYVFLLGAEGIHPLAHELYVALARGEASRAEFAGKTFRLADWQVRCEEGGPAEIVREWYGWVRFDSAGCFHPATTRTMFSNAGAAAHASDVDTSSFPGPGEIEAMRTLVFGPPAAAG